MKRLLSAAGLGIAILLAGCAVPPESEKAETPAAAKVDKAVDKAEDKAGKTDKDGSRDAQQQQSRAANQTAPDKPEASAKLRLIVIGNTLALNPSDKLTSTRRYEAYERNLAAAKQPVRMKRDWFIANSAGYVAIKYWGVAGMMSKSMQAEVSRKMKKKIHFPSELMANTLGVSTDLVAAEQNDVSGIWVTRVLCSKRKKNFDKCEDQYAKGLFRDTDGKEVDENLELVEDGERIDLKTFKKLAKKN